MSACNTVQSGNPNAMFIILIRLERVSIVRRIPKERAFRRGRSVLKTRLLRWEIPRSAGKAALLGMTS